MLPAGAERGKNHGSDLDSRHRKWSGHVHKELGWSSFQAVCRTSFREGSIGKGFWVRGVSGGNLQHPEFKFLLCVCKPFLYFWAEAHNNLNDKSIELVACCLWDQTLDGSQQDVCSLTLSPTHSKGIASLVGDVVSLCPRRSSCQCHSHSASDRIFPMAADVFH